MTEEGEEVRVGGEGREVVQGGEEDEGQLELGQNLLDIYQRRQ